MKTLHLYILRQVIATLLMTVVVFTFVLLLGNALKQILDLIIAGQVTVGVFTQAVGLLVPWIWAFALPMGMLTSTLLVFGRFSADQELTAVRASGISLISLVTPVLFLSLVMCGVSTLVNMEIAPRSRVAYKNLLLQLKVDLSSVVLPEGRPIKDFEKNGYIFYVGKNRNGQLQDVTVLLLPDKTNVTTTINAPRGQVLIDGTNQQLRIKLFDAQSVMLNGGNVQSMLLGQGDVEIGPIDLQPKAKQTEKPSISNMTFEQLRAELRDVEQHFNLAPDASLSREKLRELKAQIQKARDDFTTPIRVQLHRQLASSFACFGFTLLGIPLGIRVHRRETNVGFFIALILVMVYYGLLLVGAGLDTRPEFAPQIIVWVPNFLFQAIGAVLLWRANRGI